MSHGVTSHCGLHYRAPPGEGVFFFPCQECDWLYSDSRASSFSDFMSIQQKKNSHRYCLHEASAAETGFNTQGSTAGLSFSSAKRNISLKPQSGTQYCVWDVSCVTFVVTNTSEVWCLMSRTKVLVSHIICRVAAKLPLRSGGQFLASWYLTCMSFLFEKKHRETHMNTGRTCKLHIGEVSVVRIRTHC